MSEERLSKCIAYVRTNGYNIIIKKIALACEKERFALASKSANLYVRIEPEVKEQAEKILAALGITASNAINMFYKQIILQRGLPFDVKIPHTKPLDISTLTDEQVDAELEKGYADVVEGRSKLAKQVFLDIRKDYNL